MNKNRRPIKKLYSEIRARFYQELRNTKGGSGTSESINYSFASTRNGICEIINEYLLKKKSNKNMLKEMPIINYLHIY